MTEVAGVPRDEGVLIVDEDPTALQWLTEIVGEHHQVHSVSELGGCPAIAAAVLPELILIVQRDVTNGARITSSRIRAHPATSDIPIMIIGDGAQAELQALDAGAADFIPNPVVPAILMLRVRNQIALRRANRRLAILAGTDHLTGLANRRRFDETLQRELSRLRRSNAPLSLLMIDIDHFKSYNDTCGHPLGDECLRMVASVISAVLGRAPDLAARYGGEEFCGILPETGLEGARMVAERIRSGVSALEIDHPSSPTSRHVSVSIGVAAVNCSAIESPAEVVRLADERLYQAKNGGRNRVVAPASLSRCLS